MRFEVVPPCMRGPRGKEQTGKCLRVPHGRSPLAHRPTPLGRVKPTLCVQLLTRALVHRPWRHKYPPKKRKTWAIPSDEGKTAYPLATPDLDDRKLGE